MLPCDKKYFMYLFCCPYSLILKKICTEIVSVFEYSSHSFESMTLFNQLVVNMFVLMRDFISKKTRKFLSRCWGVVLQSSYFFFHF